MNTEELKKALDKEGVKPIYYSLNGIRGPQENDTLILEKTGNKWVYYYYERGHKFDLQYFDTEDKACQYIFQKLTKYPETRIYCPEQAAKNEILLRTVNSQNSAEAQTFLDKQVIAGKITSEEASKYMVIWNKVHSKQT